MKKRSKMALFSKNGYFPRFWDLIFISSSFSVLNSQEKSPSYFYCSWRIKITICICAKYNDFSENRGILVQNTKFYAIYSLIRGTKGGIIIKEREEYTCKGGIIIVKEREREGNTCKGGIIIKF